MVGSGGSPSRVWPVSKARKRGSAWLLSGRLLRLRHASLQIDVQGEAHSLLVFLMMLSMIIRIIIPIILSSALRSSGSSLTAANNRFATNRNRGLGGGLVLAIIIFVLRFFGLKLLLLKLLLHSHRIHHEVVVFSLPPVHGNWRGWEFGFRGLSTNTDDDIVQIRVL